MQISRLIAPLVAESGQAVSFSAIKWIISIYYAGELNSPARPAITQPMFNCQLHYSTSREEIAVVSRLIFSSSSVIAFIRTNLVHAVNRKRSLLRQLYFT